VDEEIWVIKSYCPNAVHYLVFSARCILRTDRRAIAMMYVCLSGTGVHCDHTVHVSVDLSSWLDSPMFWEP